MGSVRHTVVITSLTNYYTIVYGTALVMMNSIPSRSNKRPGAYGICRAL